VYPIPHLRSLELSGIVATVTTTSGSPEAAFLSPMPFLENIVLESCYLPYHPNISKARFVEIYSPRDRGGRPDPNVDITGLSTATQLQELKLSVCENTREHVLPTLLLFLTTLHLGLDNLPANIKNVRIPSLQRLSLALNSNDTNTRLISILLECDGIPFNQVQVLTFSIARQYYPQIKDFRFRDACYAILQACKGVEEIHADKSSAPLFLKLLRDGTESEASSNGDELDEKDKHRICFFTKKLKWELKVGRAERQLDIDAISREIGWMHIHVPWEKMIGEYYDDSLGE
jgi:hypothetical protein